ncbi:ABC transporter ATP-binding protein [uncultured Cohaesibacter sp.]|uniref:ABC transporter ATP-binding protein n=1 Tax=uncultured Cohaesibacter sp. TaxID=1002546 RepID=UPI00292D8DCD|nr:ABC transporter ATP-binding protein [uncultured Cohaesibacter sp.]
MKAIELHGLEKRFDDFVAVQALDLTVEKGEFLTLLGPSGCGKTTLLKLISGFFEPTKGTISLNGQDITKAPPESRDTAMCFQSYALFPHLDVRENLEFGLKENRVSREERKNRLDDIVHHLDLGSQLEKLPNELSGGQQQRVALGRALVMRPSVILFDEPLSNLDAKLRDSVRLEIRRIQQDYGLTAIYVTHDQSEALALSDRVLVMNKGSMEQLATPEDLYSRPATSFVADFIGNANIMDAEVIEQKDDTHWFLETPIGKLLVASDKAPVASEIRTCWRPERIELFSPAELAEPKDNLIKATVRDRSFQGGFTDLFFEAEGMSFRLQVQDASIHPGDEITFRIAPEGIILLEAKA